MESHKETLVAEAVSATIKYRDFYRQIGATGLESVSLVAHHDSSLRFTNSSTSVMKPRLLQANKDIAFIIQPATGSQGIKHWRKSQIPSEYPSYFLSMGALYPDEERYKALDHANMLISDLWAIPDVKAQSHNADSCFDDGLDRIDMQVIKADGDTGPFRHTYGLESVLGKNINFYADYPNPSSCIGTLTMIENKNARTTAWELAFDSPQIIAAIRKAKHVTRIMPAYPEVLPYSNEDLSTSVSVDAVTTSAAMMLEDLAPRAKGKEGIFRMFFSESVKLMRSYNANSDTQHRILRNAYKAEISIRNELGIHTPPLTERKDTVGNSRQWVERFNDRLSR